MITSKERRKRIVEKLREEGRQAFRDGKHIQTNPYKDMDRCQWLVGYTDEEFKQFLIEKERKEQ